MLLAYDGGAEFPEVNKNETCCLCVPLECGIKSLSLFKIVANIFGIGGAINLARQNPDTWIKNIQFLMIAMLVVEFYFLFKWALGENRGR